MALIKQMDASYTAKVNEISAARQSMLTDVASTRQMIAAAATNFNVDGMNRDTVQDAISFNMASSLLITTTTIFLFSELSGKIAVVSGDSRETSFFLF